jgi:hypothetical protein
MRNFSRKEVSCVFTKEPGNLGKAFPQMEGRGQDSNRTAELAGGIGKVAKLKPEY